MFYLLVDVSSLLWTNLLWGKDKEFSREVEYEGKKYTVNSAGYGVDNCVQRLSEWMKKLNATPRNLVLVVEGRNSKAYRTAIYPDYKVRSSSSRCPDQYVEFDKAREELVSIFHRLGAITVTQDKVEADDVIAYLAQNLEEPTYVISNDGDLQQLISDKTTVFYQGDANVNRYGPFPTRFTTLYKSLVGDNSDNIKGAYKFGETAFMKTFVTFGEEGLEELERLIVERQLNKLEEDVATLPELQKIIDSKEAVYQSYAVARLYPERINDYRNPMKVTGGLAILGKEDRETPELLRDFAATRTLVDQDNYEKVRQRLVAAFAESPVITLDIETTTPEESDDWIAAKSGGEDSSKVDVRGSELVGLSMTFGKNLQNTIYCTVRHKDAKNLTVDQVRQLVELVPKDKRIVVHNSAFELAVLKMTWGEKWMDNGWHGFLPNVIDTKILASYVDENQSAGLKKQSSANLAYQQVSYDEVTGGRKMDELTPAEVFDYGCDDTVCTAGLYDYCRFKLSLEKTFTVYEKVEISPAYLTADSFIRGKNFSLETMLAMEKDDQAAAAAARDLLNQYLFSIGWDGTVCPQVTKEADLTPAFIKAAFNIVTGEELKTQVRTVSKFPALIGALPNAEEKNHRLFQITLEGAILGGDYTPLNELVRMHFKQDPKLDIDSPKQMQKLIYETLNVPIRVRNPPTDKMREEGVFEGTPQTNEDALEYAMALDIDEDDPRTRVLRTLLTIKKTNTRAKLYYRPYRNFLHWKTNKLHAQYNQCATVTRRYSCSEPNEQQWPKKGEGLRFRECILPHHKNAVVASLDFSGQELRLMAELSQDPNMLSCFVGEKTKDMHSLTGCGIYNKMYKTDFSYGQFVGQLKSGAQDMVKRLKSARGSGKTVNFATQYDAGPAKVALKLRVEVEVAKEFMAAKEALYNRVPAWKEKVIAEVERTGCAFTLLGARRHFGMSLLSTNRYEATRTSRQGPNFWIQSSGGEETKLAMGRIWDRGITYRYDCEFYGPVHDELVFSIGVDDLVPALREIHAAMTEKYATMEVPVVSSISFGPNFGQQIEVGEEVDEALILKKLQVLQTQGFEAAVEA